MEENTMEITRLKVEISQKNEAKQDRFRNFEEARQKRAKFESEDLIRQFEEQCNIIDEQYQEFLIQAQEQEEEKERYFAELYEKNMLADEDLLNLEPITAITAIEEEQIQ